jgi:hypothetical protein
MAIVVLALATWVLLSLPAVIPGLAGLLLSWVLIGVAVFVARRQNLARTGWLVGVPTIVALAGTAPFVRREIAIYLAIVGVETGMVAVASVIGAAIASHRTNA